jgi:hypothetical protein
MDQQTRSQERRPIQRQTTAARQPVIGISTPGRRVIQRSKPIPSGVTPVRSASNSVDGQAVVTRMDEIARGMYNPFRGFGNTQVQRDVVNAFETANLQPRSIGINFTDERGLNMSWSGTVNIRMENEHAAGGAGTGTSTAAGGGTGTSGSSSSTTNTSTAGVTGSVGGERPAEGGKNTASAGANASASQATTQGSSQGATGSATTGGTSTDRVQRYECTIVAEISLFCEPDFSGTDYINPLKWGFAGAAAIEGGRNGSGSVRCGTWTYEVSQGYAPPAPAAP